MADYQFEAISFYFYRNNITQEQMLSLKALLNIDIFNYLNNLHVRRNVSLAEVIDMLVENDFPAELITYFDDESGKFVINHDDMLPANIPAENKESFYKTVVFNNQEYGYIYYPFASARNEKHMPLVMRALVQIIGKENVRQVKYLQQSTYDTYDPSKAIKVNHNILL